MQPIPKKLREELANDNWYMRCCMTGHNMDYGKIDWHHNFIYTKQVNEKWCILLLLRQVHDKEKDRDIKQRLDWIMLNRATDEELKKYNRVEDLIAKRKRLNNKFGEWVKWRRYY